MNINLPVKLAVGVFALTLTAHSHAFIITSQLTGDARADNPDKLFVNVTITQDSSDTSLAHWVIDLASPDHPDMKLDEFYFNLTGSASDYLFSTYSPAEWSIDTPGKFAGGGGGTSTFLFQAYDASKPPKAYVTNDVNLEFDMKYVGAGAFGVDNFLLSPATTLSPELGTAQLGAHLQALNLVGCGAGCSDSGFASGDYTAVPVPGTFALFAIAGIGMIASQRRRKPGIQRIAQSPSVA